MSHVDFWGKNLPGRISANEQSLRHVCLSGCHRLSEGDGNGDVVRGATWNFLGHSKSLAFTE